MCRTCTDALSNTLSKIKIRLRRRQFAMQQLTLFDVKEALIQPITRRRSLGGPARELALSGGRALWRKSATEPPAKSRRLGTCV